MAAHGCKWYAPRDYSRGLLDYRLHTKGNSSQLSASIIKVMLLVKQIS